MVHLLRKKPDTGFFDDGFTERFDIAFADLYFAAVDADSTGRRVSAGRRRSGISISRDNRTDNRRIPAGPPVALP